MQSFIHSSVQDIYIYKNNEFVFKKPVSFDSLLRASVRNNLYFLFYAIARNIAIRIGLNAY